MRSTTPLKVSFVDPLDVPHMWRRVKAYIDASIEKALGDLTTEEIKAKLISGEWRLVLSCDDEDIVGALVICFYTRINDLVAFVVALGGRAMINEPSFENLQTLLRNEGATCIEAQAQDAAVRLYQRVGFEKKSVNIKFSLR